MATYVRYISYEKRARVGQMSGFYHDVLHHVDLHTHGCINSHSFTQLSLFLTHTYTLHKEYMSENGTKRSRKKNPRRAKIVRVFI